MKAEPHEAAAPSSPPNTHREIWTPKPRAQHESLGERVSVRSLVPVAESTELRTGAQLLVDALLAQDVNLIFGYPGGAIMPVYDALYEARDRLKHVLVRHEQGATHAAEGYARVGGRVGVCLATSGPGATNLVTGIADAMMDSVPLVCITGQVPSALLGTEAFQEADIISITAPITKWNYQVRDAAEIAPAIQRAFSVAQSGRPGPVVIDLPKDIQVAKIRSAANKVSALPHQSRRVRPDFDALTAAAELLNTAQRPMLLVGHGVLLARAQQEILELAERAHLPVACTLHGLSAFPADHPLFLGLLGMHGNYAPNRLTGETDVILGVGLRFDDRVTGKASEFAPKAKIIQIEVSPEQVGKTLPVDVAIIGDARDGVRELLPLVDLAQRRDWWKQCATYAESEKSFLAGGILEPHSGPLKMSEVVHKLSALLPERSIVVADVGQHQMMCARYFACHSGRRFLSSGGLGTMGFALPAAIGAKYAAPRCDVIAVAGDGGFQMTFQELGVLMQEQLPVKVLVLNNSYLGMVRQWQELFFEGRYSSVDLANPDFVQLVRAFGIEAARVSERASLLPALENWLSQPGPSFLEVVVEQEENVFPMVPAGTPAHGVKLSRDEMK